MPRTVSAPRYLKNRAALAHAHYVAVKALLSPCATCVYKFIASDTDFHTWRRATHSIKQICAWIGYSRSAVDKALRLLRDLGLITRDGYAPPNGAPRRGVYYRLASTPSHPLPGHVLCARGDHFPDCPCTQGPTCGSTYPPKSPTTAVPALGTESHLPYPTPSRSAEGVRSARANPGESVNGTPRQRHPRPAPTPPKGRPTPRRATHAPRAPHPTLEIVAHVVAKLTPDQQRVVHARLRKVMHEQRIGTARMSERLRHWARQEARDPMKWLMHAIKDRPHGCRREDCENGILWDPVADAPVDTCRGCTERIRGRAAARNRPNREAAPPPRQPLRLVDCDWCETPMENPAPGTFLCLPCRTGVPA